MKNSVYTYRLFVLAALLFACCSNLTYGQASRGQAIRDLVDVTSTGPTAETTRTPQTREQKPEEEKGCTLPQKPASCNSCIEFAVNDPNDCEPTACQSKLDKLLDEIEKELNGDLESIACAADPDDFSAVANRGKQFLSTMEEGFNRMAVAHTPDGEEGDNSCFNLCAPGAYKALGLMAAAKKAVLDQTQMLRNKIFEALGQETKPVSAAPVDLAKLEQDITNQQKAAKAAGCGDATPYLEQANKALAEAKSLQEEANKKHTAPKSSVDIVSEEAFHKYCKGMDPSYFGEGTAIDLDHPEAMTSDFQVFYSDAHNVYREELNVIGNPNINALSGKLNNLIKEYQLTESRGSYWFAYEQIKEDWRQYYEEGEREMALFIKKQPFATDRQSEYAKATEKIIHMGALRYAVAKAAEEQEESVDCDHLYSSYKHMNGRMGRENSRKPLAGGQVRTYTLENGTKYKMLDLKPFLGFIVQAFEEGNPSIQPADYYGISNDQLRQMLHNSAISLSHDNAWINRYAPELNRGAEAKAKSIALHTALMKEAKVMSELSDEQEVQLAVIQDDQNNMIIERVVKTPLGDGKVDVQTYQRPISMNKFEATHEHSFVIPEHSHKKGVTMPTPDQLTIVPIAKPYEYSTVHGSQLTTFDVFGNPTHINLEEDEELSVFGGFFNNTMESLGRLFTDIHHKLEDADSRHQSQLGWDSEDPALRGEYEPILGKNLGQDVGILSRFHNWNKQFMKQHYNEGGNFAFAKASMFNCRPTGQDSKTLCELSLDPNTDNADKKDAFKGWFLKEAQKKIKQYCNYSTFIDKQTFTNDQWSTCRNNAIEDYKKELHKRTSLSNEEAFDKNGKPTMALLTAAYADEISQICAFHQLPESQLERHMNLMAATTNSFAVNRWMSTQSLFNSFENEGLKFAIGAVTMGGFGALSKVESFRRGTRTAFALMQGGTALAFGADNLRQLPGTFKEFDKAWEFGDIDDILTASVPFILVAASAGFDSYQIGSAIANCGKARKPSSKPKQDGIGTTQIDNSFTLPTQDVPAPKNDAPAPKDFEITPVGDRLIRVDVNVNDPSVTTKLILEQMRHDGSANGRDIWIAADEQFFNNNAISMEGAIKGADGKMLVPLPKNGSDQPTAVASSSTPDGNPEQPSGSNEPTLARMFAEGDPDPHARGNFVKVCARPHFSANDGAGSLKPTPDQPVGKPKGLFENSPQQTPGLKNLWEKMREIDNERIENVVNLHQIWGNGIEDIVKNFYEAVKKGDKETAKKCLEETQSSLKNYFNTVHEININHNYKIDLEVMQRSLRNQAPAYEVQVSQPDGSHQTHVLVMGSEPIVWDKTPSAIDPKAVADGLIVKTVDGNTKLEIDLSNVKDRQGKAVEGLVEIIEGGIKFNLEKFNKLAPSHVWKDPSIMWAYEISLDAIQGMLRGEKKAPFSLELSPLPVGRMKHPIYRTQPERNFFAAAQQQPDGKPIFQLFQLKRYTPGHSRLEATVRIPREGDPHAMVGAAVPKRYQSDNITCTANEHNYTGTADLLHWMLDDAHHASKGDLWPVDNKNIREFVDRTVGELNGGRQKVASEKLLEGVAVSVIMTDQSNLSIHNGNGEAFNIHPGNWEYRSGEDATFTSHSEPSGYRTNVDRLVVMSPGTKAAFETWLQSAKSKGDEFTFPDADVTPGNHVAVIENRTGYLFETRSDGSKVFISNDAGLHKKTLETKVIDVVIKCDGKLNVESSGRIIDENLRAPIDAETGRSLADVGRGTHDRSRPLSPEETRIKNDFERNGIPNSVDLNLRPDVLRRRLRRIFDMTPEEALGVPPERGSREGARISRETPQTEDKLASSWTNEANQGLYLEAFPIPTSRSITVAGSLSDKTILHVYDMVGNEVLTTAYWELTDATIDVSSFQPGVYMIVAEQDDQVLRTRFVKQ